MWFVNRKISEIIFIFNPTQILPSIIHEKYKIYPWKYTGTCMMLHPIHRQVFQKGIQSNVTSKPGISEYKPSVI